MHTEKKNTSIKTQFAERKRNQIIVSVPLIAMIILLVLSGENPDQLVLGMPVAVWGPAFAALVAGGVGFSLYNWRCPACNKYLGKSINPKFCAKCGAALS